MSQVIFDYTAENLDELTLVTGQFVRVNKEPVDGWGEGECDGKSGLFPDNFVQPATYAELTTFHFLSSIDLFHHACAPTPLTSVARPR